MTKVIVPPIAPGPIPEDRFAQNGDMPSQTALRRVATGYNHVAVNQRKLVFAKSYYTQSTYTPASANEITNYFSFRTGENVSELCVWLGLAPATSTNGTNKASTEVGFYDGSTTVITRNQFYPKVQSGAFQPSEVAWFWTKVTTADGILANTDYCGYVNQFNYSRVHTVVVYEKSDKIAVSTVDGVCNPLNWETSKPIYDANVQELAETGTKLWRHNAKQLLSISREDSTTSFTVNSATASNIHSSATAWSATAPGYILETQYHDTQSGDVPVELAARIRRTAGTGDLTISLEQNGSTLLSKTFSGTSTTPHAITTGTITAQAGVKTDVFAKCSNGTTTYEIDCIGLWEYES